MKSLHVEILMGHSVGFADYYCASEEEFLDSYVAAIPHLTISETYDVRSQFDKKITERIAARDRKVAELEKMGLDLRGRLSGMEEQVVQIRT